MAEGDYVASWTSDDRKIVKVNSKGKLTAQKKTKKITGLKKKLTMKQKQKLTLLPKLLPITTSDKVKYSSSNKKVVTVNGKGKLVAKKAGTAKITV